MNQKPTRLNSKPSAHNDPHASPPAAPPYHRLPTEEVLRLLGSRALGLSSDEAAAALKRFGRNEIAEHQDHHLLRALGGQFTHLMAILLWVGAGIAFFIRLPELAVAIIAVILINGAFSFWQEFRAERATEELARILPRETLVLRDGSPRTVPAAELTPGDVIILDEGNAIPADARLIESHSFATSDAALTGESAPMPRNSEPMSVDPTQIWDAANRIFAGTLVASGRATAVVTATGDHTVFGAIAALTQTVIERPSPLQRELDTAVRAISLVAVGVGLTFSTLALVFVKLDAATALMFALGLVVAFVPEGLLPTMSLSLAMGVQRMARRKALVKHLSAVEALGAASVIATDKTGVLTENRMTVVGLLDADGREWRVTGSGYAPTGEILPVDGDAVPRRTESPGTSLGWLLRAAALCNYARLESPREPDGEWSLTGDPTEGALQALAAKGGVRVEELLSRVRLAAEWPFDARRQRMSVAFPAAEGMVLLTKGSPPSVLEKCSHIAAATGVRMLTPEDRGEIDAVRARFARSGLRVLALAQRPLLLPELTANEDSVERDLVFLGLAAMQDPPRAEVPRAVEQCGDAGIRIVIVSGDQGSTVAAIGRQVGIIRGESPRILEGNELADLSDEALRGALSDGSEVVFARTPPEGKLRVVGALQTLGNVVAVTGDGVNDAPALRQADIGVAMGRGGTDVARAAADIVLSDDNFASIVAAVEEGRAVFDNIRKFTTYCFTSNAAEAVPFVLFLVSAGHIPLALPIMLVLAVDLGTDLFPALALGAEAAETDVMQRPPRARGAHLISGGVLVRSLVWLGLLEGAAGMAAFYWIYGDGGGGAELLARARAGALAGIVAAQAANLFVCRSERGAAFARKWNPLLLPSLVLEFGLLLAAVYLPALQRVFGTAALSPRDWIVPALATPLFFAAEEIRKAITRARQDPTRPLSQARAL